MLVCTLKYSYQSLCPCFVLHTIDQKLWITIVQNPRTISGNVRFSGRSLPLRKVSSTRLGIQIRAISLCYTHLSETSRLYEETLSLHSSPESLSTQVQKWSAKTLWCSQTLTSTSTSSPSFIAPSTCQEAYSKGGKALMPTTSAYSSTRRRPPQI